jgi:DHA1 family tetracycline resistance protein-like MFS transporter
VPVLLLTTFISLVGFGIIIPLLPFYVQQMGASPTIITITMGLYSLAQFVASPIWGKLSDKYGRRPILIWSLLGTIVSYLLLAFADTLGFLIFTRILGGLMAGNLGAAYAYVSDISTEQDRSKYMGFMGASFGLGFIFGPAIGGVLAGADVETANYVLPALAAAGLSTIAFFGVIFFLPESLKPEIREKLAHAPKVALSEKLRMALARPVLSMLIIVSLLFITAFAAFEVIYPLWVNLLLDYGPQQIGFLLTYVGIISVIVQGGLIGPLNKRFGDERLAVSSVVLAAAGYLWLANSTTFVGMMIAQTLLSGGAALFNPTSTSLVSKEAVETEQGAVLGVYQGVSALGRIIGPAYAGAAFGKIGYAAPYLIGALFMIPSLILMVMVMQRKKVAIS